MTNRHTILIGLSILFLMALLIYGIFREYGYSHLSSVRLKKRGIIQMNAQIARENHHFRVEIDRLKHDCAYIESIARQELGMVKADELILKPGSSANSKK